MQLKDNDLEDIASKITSALDSASSNVTLLFFAVKFLACSAVYVLLKNFCSQAAAELWMLAVLGFILFKYELLIGAVVKAELLKKMIDGEEDNGSEETEEDKEQSSRQEDLD